MSVITPGHIFVVVIIWTAPLAILGMLVAGPIAFCWIALKLVGWPGLVGLYC